MAECDNDTTFWDDLFDLLLVIILVIIVTAVFGGLLGAIIGAAITGAIKAWVAVIIMLIIGGLYALTLYLLYLWLMDIISRVKDKIIPELIKQVIEYAKVIPGLSLLGIVGMIYISYNWALKISG